MEGKELGRHFLLLGDTFTQLTWLHEQQKHKTHNITHTSEIAAKLWISVNITDLL